MASLPRIMVVDHQNSVGRVVRSTLNLLNYPAIVVEIPSSTEALLELQSIHFAVLVTAYNLPSMNGLELARRATTDVPDIKVIVLANAEDQLPDDEVPFTMLTKPLAADRFTKALRLALGEEVEEKAIAEPLDTLGPVPEVNLDDLSGILNSALINVGAMAAILIDRTGALLVEEGAVGYLDREKLAATIAPAFATLAHAAEVIGGKASALYVWDGKEYDIYGLSAGLHHFVCLVFESASGKAALGPVSRWGREAMQDMVKVIGPPAYEVAKAAPPPPKSKRKAAPAPLTKHKAAAPTPAPSVAPPSKPQPRKAKKRPPAPPSPTVEVDDNTLQEALSKTGDMDPDAFWDNLGQDGDAVADALSDEDALSFEEALQLGLLPPEISGGGGK